MLNLTCCKIGPSSTSETVSLIKEDCDHHYYQQNSYHPRGYTYHHHHHYYYYYYGYV